MTFQDNIPIYVQIADDIKAQIISSKLNDNDKLNSIREYSAMYQVTALTMQRAMALLEAENVIHTKKGIGSFVNPGTRETLRSKILAAMVREFITRATNMGLTHTEITELIKEGLKNE